MALPLLVAAACSSGQGDSSSATTPAFPHVNRAAGIVRPWVTSRGGRFVDASGRPVLLRGVDVTLTPPLDYSRAVGMHANFVRIVAPWSLFEPVAPSGSAHHWDRAMLHRLDQEVSFFRAHRINVLIDFHQFHWSPYFAGHHCAASGKCLARGIPGWYYADGRFPDSGSGERAAQKAFFTSEAARSLADYAAFAAMMATRYARDPNVVGYEILNEPHPGDLGDSTAATDTMLRWQARIRGVLQRVDPTRTAFVMCSGGGQGVGTANLGLLGSPDHLALDWHDYFNGHSGTGLDSTGDTWVPSWPATHNQKTAAYTGTLAAQDAVIRVIVARARRWHVPLLVGEWGVHTGSPGSAAYQSQMFTLFRRYGVSFARWELTSGGGFGLLTDSGGSTREGLQLTAELAAPPPA